MVEQGWGLLSPPDDPGTGADSGERKDLDENNIMLEMAEYNDKAGLTSAAVGKNGLAPLTLGLMIPELAPTSRLAWQTWTTTGQGARSTTESTTYRSMQRARRDRKLGTGLAS